jgi:hypothetical protein
MKSLLIATVFTFATSAFAYQVTGPILEVTATKLVVDKKGEKFEFAITPALKVTGGELKVGNKVTVQYSISATDIEVKGDKKAKK